MTSSNGQIKAILAYIAVCILWGSTYLAIRIGVKNFPPELFAGIRFIIAGTVIMLFCYLKKYTMPNNLKSIIQQSIIGIFLLFGGNGLVVWAEQWVNSGTTALVIATVPLFMSIIELFIPNSQKLTTIGWLGMALGFFGVSLLVFSNNGTSALDVGGIVILIAASLSWAIGSVYSKFSKVSGNMLVNISIQMLSGGAALIILGLFLGEWSRVKLSYEGLGALLYLIVFGSIIGYSCYIYLLQKWPAAKVGTYAYVNPLVAILLGTIILKETLTLKIIISTCVILTGVLLVQLSKTKLKKTT